MSMVRRAAGFTLIELMIAVAIVSILAAIALPSYRSSVVKANRRNAQAAMLEIAQREQQYLLDQRSYGSIAALKYTSPDNMASLYTLTVAASVGPPPSFTITATPKSGSMQAGDATLTLDNLGAKTPADKW